MPEESTIEEKVGMSLAIGRYVRAASRFNEASSDFTKSCKDLRSKLGTNKQFICNIDHKHYLVTSDIDGNFDVEEIESL